MNTTIWNKAISLQEKLPSRDFLKYVNVEKFKSKTEIVKIWNEVKSHRRNFPLEISWKTKHTCSCIPTLDLLNHATIFIEQTTLYVKIFSWAKRYFLLRLASLVRNISFCSCYKIFTMKTKNDQLQTLFHLYNTSLRLYWI